MKRLASSLAMIPAAYMLGAFVAADFNPAAWAIEGRLATAIFGVFASLAAYSCPIWWDE